jgi:hypothetical protein
MQSKRTARDGKATHRRGFESQPARELSLPLLFGLKWIGLPYTLEFVDVTCCEYSHVLVARMTICPMAPHIQPSGTCKTGLGLSVPRTR